MPRRFLHPACPPSADLPGPRRRGYTRRLELYDAADGLIYPDVRCLLEDREGAVWMGTIHGLSRYQNGRCTSFTAAGPGHRVEVRGALSYC
jgi:ligand-binding sensor domain-containing protein